MSQFDGTRSRELSKKMWNDCVKGELRELDIRDWKVVAEDCHIWSNAVVESAKTLLG